MTRPIPIIARVILCLTLSVSLFPLAVEAQENPRSQSGRHLPRVEKPAVPEVEGTSSGDPRVWGVRAFAGNLRGGDLFEAQVVTGVAVPWVGLDPGGFKTSRFKARFENNPSFGIEVTRNLAADWRVSLGLRKSTLDVAANALVGQTGGRFRYDRMGVLTVQLGVQRDLVSLAAAPYLLGGLQLTRLDPTVNDDLGQSRFGWRLGLGYRQPVGDTTNLFLEGAVDRISLSRNGFTPVTQPPFDPQVVVEFRDRATFLGFQMGIEARF